MARITRRDLLEDALFASTTVALAAGGAQRAWAREAGPAKSFGPNDTIRVAVIGVRGRGKDHISGFLKTPGVEVATICDADLGVVAQAVQMVTKAGRPAPKVVQDLRHVMDDPAIDAVSIATPNHWHSLAAIWAMQAGKDVYVEKPVSHNVREGRVMVDTARKYRRICQAGTQCRSMKGSQDAIRYVHEGKIGKVTLARGLCYKPRPSTGRLEAGKLPASVDWSLWLGPAPMREFHQNRFHYNWHWQWDFGNGDLGNQGIHQVDVARWGLKQSGFPKSVVGLGGRLGYEDDGETPNTHVAVFDYGENQLIFETRGLKTGDYRGARVGNVFHGTDGYVVLTSYTGGAAFDADGKLVTTFSGGGDHYANFIAAMRSRRVEDLTGEIYEGHVSSALCHLGNISYLLGEKQSFGARPRSLEDNEAGLESLTRMEQHLAENGVDMMAGHYQLGPKLALDADKERFKSGDANKLLTRKYREGFVVPKKA